MFSAFPPVACANSFAAVCVTANPRTVPLLACHAADTTPIVVVFRGPDAAAMCASINPSGTGLIVRDRHRATRYCSSLSALHVAYRPEWWTSYTDSPSAP
jgi:hypothetical protein